MLSLVTPSVGFERSYRSYIDELGNTERYPFTLDLPADDFATYVDRLSNFSQGIDLPEGTVTNSTFWLTENNEIVGVSNLRHHMTDKLLLLGGHIGFGVRPSAQGRGIAKELLRLTLIEAAKLGIYEVLLICLKENESSARVIAANGGQLESEYAVPEYDGLLQRYKVDTRQ